MGKICLRWQIRHIANMALAELMCMHHYWPYAILSEDSLISTHWTHRYTVSHSSGECRLTNTGRSTELRQKPKRDRMRLRTDEQTKLNLIKSL